MKSKIAKIFLDDAGSFLGRGEDCLMVRDRKRNVKNQEKVSLQGSIFDQDT